MSTSLMKLYITKMISKYGQTVRRKAATRVEEDGDYYYTYADVDPIKGQFSQILPTDEAMMQWGFRVEADYIGTCLPDVIVEENDLLYIDDSWQEVQNKVVRRTKGIADYIELLLRRKDQA